MASEDVIELGSSDDEAEPATKKMKPMTNAMVHIPRKFAGVTIKPAKSNPIGIPKSLQGKPVTITKVIPNPYANRIKMNGHQIHNTIIQPAKMKHSANSKRNVTGKQQFGYETNIRPVHKSNTIDNSGINPLSIVKLTNSQTSMKKVPVKFMQGHENFQNNLALNNLPPSITITKTSSTQKRPRPMNVSCVATKKLKKSTPVSILPSEVLTVDLDDDEASSSSTASPQWYLRPEEQDDKIDAESVEKQESKEKTQNTEEKDTKSLESDAPKSIEITIEDSPVKPAKSKRTFEVEIVSAITIDDSPVKPVVEKNVSESGSDDESNTTNKVPHSKKRLEYPKEDTNTDTKTFEIEVPPLDDDKNKYSTQRCPNVKLNKEIVVEIEDSPAKVETSILTSTPKKNHPKTISIEIQKLKADCDIEKQDKIAGEFHPTYQSFIDLCFDLENSNDMKKIVEKKIKTYYRQVPKEYTESEEFLDMVSSKIIAMKASPEKMYLYIKDIVDELNLQRKIVKTQPTVKESKNEEADKFLYGEDSEYDSKRQRQIRKLEKTLKKLHRAIQKLEEQEVDFDDEEDSVYLLTESEEDSSSSKDKPVEKDPKVLLKRYKERMVRVHAKFCQLTNTKMPSEPRVHIDARPGQPTGPAKRLEKWVNKKVPIGTPLPFPDFHDVLHCVREANEQDKLGWNEVDVMEEARDLFTRCGKKLQRRRQENEWRLAASRISADIDPAEKSDELKKKLADNKQSAAKKETEVLNKFADRQNQLNLEAVEIGDKEADESPVESEDDDEPTDEANSMESKEKRKQRLKRLLQEKSKKSFEENSEKNTDTNKDIANKDITSGSEQEDGKIKPSEETETSQADTNISKQENEVDKKEIDADKVTDEKETEKENKDAAHKSIEENEKEEKLNDDKTKTGDSISDDNKVESDIDELHLLQKLHSENEVNTSTLDSSDSDTPIAISDTLDSNEDNKKNSSDVISIENSSYSESEVNKTNEEVMERISIAENKEADKGDVQSVFVSKIVNTIALVNEKIDDNMEIECSSSGIQKKVVTTNNDEYNESVEDILLASSDEESEKNNDLDSAEEVSVNLKDDSISIGETVIEGDNVPNSNAAHLIENMDVDPDQNIDSNANIENDSADSSDVMSSKDIMSAEDNVHEKPNKNVEVFSIESSETLDDDSSKDPRDELSPSNSNDGVVSDNIISDTETINAQENSNNNDNETPNHIQGEIINESTMESISETIDCEKTLTPENVIE